MYGSIERFLGMLLEHHGGQLPAWIAPEQVLVAPVGEAHREHATAVVMVMAAAGLRVRLDAEESLARRIAIAHELGVPFIAVIGDREIADGSIAIRERRARWSASVPEAVARLVTAAGGP